jgi:hypothetical protein
MWYLFWSNVILRLQERRIERDTLYVELDKVNRL